MTTVRPKKPQCETCRFFADAALSRRGGGSRIPRAVCGVVRGAMGGFRAGKRDQKWQGMGQRQSRARIIRHSASAEAMTALRDSLLAALLALACVAAYGALAWVDAR